jgi:hypothetical protein
MSRKNDEGVALVEIVIAIVLLGGAIAALMGAITTATMGSKTHRDLATQDTVVRSYAEAVKREVRETCTVGGTFSMASYTPPAGYTPTVSSTNCPSAVSGTDGAPVLTVTVTGPTGTVKTMNVAVRIP